MVVVVPVVVVELKDVVVVVDVVTVSVVVVEIVPEEVLKIVATAPVEPVEVVVKVSVRVSVDAVGAMTSWEHADDIAAGPAPPRSIPGACRFWR